MTGLLFKIQTLTSQPNPPVSSKSSRKLHTALHHAVRYIVDINVEIQGHWDAERRFAIVRETDERVVFTSEEVYTRRSEYDAVSGRFVKWLRVIDLRTRSEREVRESGGVAKPRGLGKYFHGEAGSVSPFNIRIPEYC